MKHVIIALFAVLFSFSAFGAEKSKFEYRLQENKDKSSLFAMKETTEDGAWGIVLVCHPDYDEANLVIITPTGINKEGEEVGYRVGRVAIVGYKGGRENSIVPFDTDGGAMWPIGVAAGVIASTEYGNKYAIRFYKPNGDVLYQTRLVSDTELRRISGKNGRHLKNCNTSDVVSKDKWELFADYSFSIYDQYKK